MIVLKVKTAKSLKEKIFGLIGKKRAEPLLIKTRFGIHTFFLKFPIDVIVLDKNYEVKDIKESMQPNRIFIWNPLYNIVVEMPKKTIAEKKIKTGDKIRIISLFDKS